MKSSDLLKRVPFFLVVLALVSALNPGDPFYAHGGALQPHFWAAVVLSVWLGLWTSAISTGVLAAAMLFHHSMSVDRQEVETVFTFQDLVRPFAVVLVSTVVGYLADRLRDATEEQRQRGEQAERTLVELGALNEQVSRARKALEQEIFTLTRTPAKVAEVAERFEVGSASELLRNLLRVTSEHVESRSAAIYRYDSFSRWELVEERAPEAGSPHEFPRAFTDAELDPTERSILHGMLQGRGAPVAWINGQVIQAQDIVVPLGSMGGGPGATKFLGVLVHRGVDFAETSPSVRAMLEALTRWASLVLKREELKP